MRPSVDDAVRALARGGLVVYPTDTLYGLGARAEAAAAVRRLATVKDRPGGLPLSIAVSSLEEIEPWADLDPARRSFARRALPGPYTLLLPASARARRRFAPGIVGPDGTLGVRVPDHPVARELARRVGPMTATSANRHGEPPATSVRAARGALGASVDCYLDAPPRPSGRPSWIADLRGAEPRVVVRS